jgi:hypothetical protein
VAAESFLVGAIGFVVYACLFIFLLRLRLRIGWLLLELVLGLIVHVLTSALGVLFITGFSYWYNLSLFAFLWFCLFFVSSIYSVSVTVGIIRYLYNAPDHSASVEEIHKYCIEAPFIERAKFLVNSGQAQKMDQYYLSTTTGKQAVQRIRWINKILGMESKGFYTIIDRDLVNR